MNPLPKDKRNKLILLAFGTLVVLAGLWFAILSPQCRKLAEIAKKTADAENKLADGQRTTASAEATEAGLQNTAGKLQAIESGMPSGDLYAWFIQTLDQFRQPYRVELPQKSREVMGDAGLLPKFPYRAATFTVRGGAYYHDFGKFLADFENHFPYLRVQNLELEASSLTSTNSTDREKLTFKIEIVALLNPTAP